ncbi:hypothetical protein BZA77DRAFT_255287, partial [Pyronema omphalodes]
IIGARIFSPSGNPSYLSKTIGWILDAGYDLPKDVLWVLDGYCINLILRRDQSRRTAGCFSGASGERDEKMDGRLLEVRDFLELGLASARCVHMIGAPVRVRKHIEGLKRISGGDAGVSIDGDVPEKSKQILVWELEGEWCKPEYREATIQAARDVDVVIMTSTDLLGLWRDVENEMVSYGEELRISCLAPMMVEEVNKTGQTTTTVVVRDGKLGALIATPEMLDAPEKFMMLPNYYKEGDTMVVDTQGAGNAFAGGMGVGLVRTGDVVKAAALGVVAESFVVEQIGIPHLEATDTGEMWNDDFCSERVEKYVEMLQVSGIELGLDISALGIQFDPYMYDDEDEEEAEEELEVREGQCKDKDENGKKDGDDDNDDDWEFVEAEKST